MLYHCPSFLSSCPSQRVETVLNVRHQQCFNYLAGDHVMSQIPAPTDARCASRSTIHVARSEASRPSDVSSGNLCLKPEDVQIAKQHWLVVIQRDCFPAELRALSHGRPLATTSSILGLCPFLDEDVSSVSGADFGTRDSHSRGNIRCSSALTPLSTL